MIRIRRHFSAFRPRAGAAVAALAALAVAPPAGAGDPGRRDLREYSPSALLSPGESELKLFHNLYTQTRYYDDDGVATAQGARSSWYTGTATLRIGWRERANIAVEATVRAVRDETRAPAFATRQGLTSITPRIQFLPFPSHGSFTAQTGIRVPLGSELEGDARDPFLDFADVAWTAQLLFDRALDADWRLYLEVGSFARLAGDASQVTTPAKVILNWEPDPRWTLYVPAEIAPDWLGDGSGNYYSQIGLGAKLRPGRGDSEIEFLWTTFPRGRNAGAGQTVNLGLRFLR